MLQDCGLEQCSRRQVGYIPLDPAFPRFVGGNASEEVEMDQLSPDLLPRGGPGGGKKTIVAVLTVDLSGWL